MKAFIVFAIATVTTSLAAQAATPKAKTLSCKAELLTEALNDQSTTFTTVLVADSDTIPAGKKMTYRYRNDAAFKSKDGRFTIGVQAAQPLNDSTFAHDIVTIWAKDSQSGLSAEAGGGLFGSYKTDVDHMLLTLGSSVKEGEALKPGEEILYVTCDLN